MKSVDLAIFEGALQQVCSEMDLALERTAFSSIVSESRDRSSGIYDLRTGAVISQGRTGLPIFIGIMQYSVAALIAETSDLRPGDVFIMNDPYRGGTHLMDVRLVSPYFYDGEPQAFLATTAHWADIGGPVPGGFGASAQTIYAEGLRLAPVRIRSEGVLVADVKRLILANVRLPWEREGDLLAQLAALEVGRERLDDVMAKYGASEFHSLASQLSDYSERVMRDHLGKLPNGLYASEARLDDDGVDFSPLVIHCQLNVRGSAATVDFEGSSPRCQGPLNAPVSATQSAVLIAFMHSFPDVPINHGSFRPLNIRIPAESFLFAKYPAAVAGGSSEVPARVIDAVLLALGRASDELCQGEAFSTSCNLTLHGSKIGVEYVMYFFAGGGYGGHARGDGLSNGCQPLSMAKTSPIEMFEERYPIRFDRYALRDNSCGLGKCRGGLGVAYEFVFEGERAELSFLMDRGRFAPGGVAGGTDGALTEVEIEKASGELYRPPHLTKAQGIPIDRGDRIRVATPGGGGFGLAADRDPELIERDQRAGYL